MQTPVASTAAATWESLLAGRSGIATITAFDASQFPTRIAGEVKNIVEPSSIDAKRFRKQDRFAQLALCATAEAINDANLRDTKIQSDRIAVSLGTGVGGMGTFEEEANTYSKRGFKRISPFMVPKMMPNAMSAAVSIEFGFTGPALTLCSACTSSSDAIAIGRSLIQTSQADIVVTGGAESTITPVGLSGFVAARSLSESNEHPDQASRPFDKGRDGFVLSEGAATLILEDYEHAKSRGATIYAELIGTGQSSDAFHVTAPLPSGTGAATAMTKAMHDAAINPADVKYVNAHATGTHLGDVAETQAIQSAFGHHASRLIVNATKSLIGHTLGASGSIAIGITALSMRDGVVHGTKNLDYPEDVCRFGYLGKDCIQAAIDVALVNSFGFGGHNASVVLSKV